MVVYIEVDMTQGLFVTSGGKAVNLLQSEDPEVWDYYTGRRNPDIMALYARVAAAFTAVNKDSRTVSSVPFVILKGDREIDNSSDWQNKLGFMPNPRDLIRRLQQSLIFYNMAYARMGKTQLGTPKRLHFTMKDSIKIVTDPVTNNLVSLDRTVNGRVIESYAPDDYSLLRFWWLDADTELIPTDNTPFKAILNAAGVLYWSDAFTKLYFQRGGVKPTLIAMKGLVKKEMAEDMQKDWTTFVRGIGQGIKNISAKIFNAEAMSIEPFGEGLGDLGETPVFRQALENIAIGLDMPMSILLSNSANYATAQTEQRIYWRQHVIPSFDFIADIFNEQLLAPLGYRMENRAEVEDSEQEEEVERATAISSFMDFLVKCPTADIALGTCATFGYELTEELVTAIEAYFADKESRAEEVQEQMEPSAESSTDTEPEEEEEEEDEPVKTWMPTLDHLEEMKIWREVAQRRFRRAESLDFEYQPHKGGLPNPVTDSIKAALVQADSMEAVKSAFDVARFIAPDEQPEPVTPSLPDDDILKLAKAMNKFAEAFNRQPAPQPNITVYAQPSPAPAVTVNVPEAKDVPAPVVNVDVNPTPVEVMNTVNVENSKPDESDEVVKMIRKELHGKK